MLLALGPMRDTTRPDACFPCLSCTTASVVSRSRMRTKRRQLPRETPNWGLEGPVQKAHPQPSSLRLQQQAAAASHPHHTLRWWERT